MAKTYVILSADDSVVGIVQATSAVENPQYTEVSAYDEALVGQLYDRTASAAAGHAVFTAPPAVVQPPDPRLWWVDVGPFYDRFGPDALAIAASDHGACKAVQTLTGVRKYIDLRDQRVAAMIDMLTATQQPAAQAWAPGSGPMTATKKAAILNTPTTEAERHIKGLEG